MVLMAGIALFVKFLGIRAHTTTISYYSQVGYLNNTTSSLSLFYAGFIGGVVVLIADY